MGGRKSSKHVGDSQRRPDVEPPAVESDLDAVSRTAIQDANVLADYLDDLPLPRRAEQLPQGLDRWLACEKELLSRMYEASLNGDADASPSLRILALQFATNPCAPLAADGDHYTTHRDQKGWTIRRHNSAFAARIWPAISSPQWAIRAPFRVGILDCPAASPT